MWKVKGIAKRLKKFARQKQIFSRQNKFLLGSEKEVKVPLFGFFK
jgi:hypothetical protein